MNFKKYAAVALAAVCVIGTLTGCANSKTGEAQTAEEQAAADDARLLKELQLNDYRGSVTRTLWLKDDVLQTMENMKSNNVTLRTDNPNSFWNTEGYQDFVVNFLSAPIINDGKYFNEEETDWDTIVSAMTAEANSFTVKSEETYKLNTGVTIERNEKDDYSVNGVPFEGKFLTDANTTKFTGKASYRFLYDCDKDWSKAYATLSVDDSLNIAPFTVDMYEYCRIDNNTFAIQTNRERLYVVFEPVETDVDFRERVVKEFYYSKLTQDGMRTGFTPYVALLEYDEETGKYDQTVARRNTTIQGYKVINDTGDIATVYGKNDSLFLTDDIAKQITPEWVFEDGSLQQAICYKDKALVVTTYNKLSEKYERFIYSAESVKDEDIKKLEVMVSIEGLVGEQEIPEIEIPEVDKESFADPKTTEPTPEETVAEGEETTETAADASEMDALREQIEAQREGGTEPIVEGTTAAS